MYSYKYLFSLNLLPIFLNARLLKLLMYMLINFSFIFDIFRVTVLIGGTQDQSDQSVGENDEEDKIEHKILFTDV